MQAPQIAFWLFPFSGLLINDAPHNLGAAADFYVGANAAWVSEQTGIQLIGEASHKLLLETFDSIDGFLAVRWAAPDDQNHAADQAPEVLRRAKELSALFTLMLRINPPGTCALAEQFRENIVQTHQSIAISADHQAHYIALNPTVLYRRANPPMQITRQTLLNRLQQNPGMFPLIFTNDLTPNAELRRSIRQAAVHTAEAFIAPSAEEQCVRSINAVESLFGRDFEMVARRIRTLLGEVSFETYHTQEVIESRHNFVHHGDRVGTQMGVNSIFMALDVMRRICRLIQNLPAPAPLSRNRLMELIDFEATHAAYTAAAEDREILLNQIFPGQGIQPFNPVIQFDNN